MPTRRSLSGLAATAASSRSDHPNERRRLPYTAPELDQQATVRLDGAVPVAANPPVRLPRAVRHLPSSSKSAKAAGRKTGAVSPLQPEPRRRRGNTPPAEVRLQYIFALTSRYAGWPSQPSRAARSATATVEGGFSRPADRETRPAKLRASYGSWPSQDAADGFSDSAARYSALMRRASSSWSSRMTMRQAASMGVPWSTSSRARAAMRSW
jgi:hypothetical protein